MFPHSSYIKGGIAYITWHHVFMMAWQLNPVYSLISVNSKWSENAPQNILCVRFHNSILIRCFLSPTHHMPKSLLWVDVCLSWMRKAILIFWWLQQYLFALWQKQQYTQVDILIHHHNLEQYGHVDGNISSESFCWNKTRDCAHSSSALRVQTLLLYWSKCVKFREQPKTINQNVSNKMLGNIVYESWIYLMPY